MVVDTKKAMLALALFGLMAVPFMALMDDANAEQLEPQTYTIYMYEAWIKSTAKDAENVMWDFGDGTPPLDSRSAGTPEYEELLATHGGNVWYPVHKYPEIRDRQYTITQTVWNSYEGGTVDTQTHHVVVKGHPIVTFAGEGIDIAPVEVPYVATNAQPLAKPTDPSREGFDFKGWFVDDAHTQAFDFGNDVVAKHMTLHAKWVEAGSEPEPEPEPVVEWTVRVVMHGTQVKTATVADGETYDPGIPGVSYFLDAEGGEAWIVGTPVTSDLTLYAISPYVPKDVSMVTVGVVAVAAILAVAALLTRRPAVILAAVLAALVALYLFLGDTGRL